MHLISHTMTAIARLALLLMVTCAGCLSSPAEEIKVNIRVRAPLAPTLRLRRLPGALVLDVGTESGLSYGVQTATQLSGWSTMVTLAGTGTTVSWTHAISAAEPRRFYRIITPP